MVSGNETAVGSTASAREHGRALRGLERRALRHFKGMLSEMQKDDRQGHLRSRLTFVPDASGLGQTAATACSESGICVFRPTCALAFGSEFVGPALWGSPELLGFRAQLLWRPHLGPGQTWTLGHNTHPCFILVHVQLFPLCIFSNPLSFNFVDSVR